MKLENFKPEYISNYFPGSSSSGICSSGKEIYPSTYLGFAKDDILEDRDRRNLVNAVGNAKRAFHFQVEMLCEAFGWKAKYKNRIYGFPERLEYLGKCGLLSPNILKKLNKKRNDIEHDYYVPTWEEVEDYIDIVELFLMATKSFLDEFPEDVDYELMEDEYYDSSLGLPKNLRIEIKMEAGGINMISGDDKLEKSINDSDYFEWLAAIMRHHVL